ncbi:hypothetical protein NMY22_g15646 [Coprinellus aureogranulatus]|nr:hypothetical protein NMY22_g15646 [Coprinellus aureogranulatus]
MPPGRPGSRVLSTATLLRRVNKCTYAEDLPELADRIAKEKDYDFLTRSLTLFNGPLVDLDDTSKTGPRVDACFDITSLMKLMSKAPPSPALDEYMERFYGMLMPHWQALVGCLEELLLKAAGLDESHYICATCCDALLAVVSGARDNEYMEEIAAQQCSVELLFMLLSNQNPNDENRPFYVWNSHEKGCRIA